MCVVYIVHVCSIHCVFVCSTHTVCTKQCLVNTPNGRGGHFAMKKRLCGDEDPEEEPFKLG